MSNIGYLIQKDSSYILNKVTYGINSINPLTIHYDLSDSANNEISLNRIINIIDDIPPNIDFSFNIKPTDVSLQYWSFNYNYRDFSYLAFNYTISNEQFIQELSSILFNFDLSDNYEISQTNYKINISGENFNIKNNTDISNSIEFKNYFSKIDTSFDITYEISDNQYNTKFFTRNVIIYNSISLDLSFINDISKIDVSFGDTCFNILSDLSITHIRLKPTDISFDISYRLPDGIEFPVKPTNKTNEELKNFIKTTDLSNIFDFDYLSDSSQIILFKNDIIQTGDEITNKLYNFKLEVSGNTDISFIIENIHTSSTSIIDNTDISAYFDISYTFFSLKDNIGISISNNYDISLLADGSNIITLSKINSLNTSDISNYFNVLLDSSKNKYRYYDISYIISNDINYKQFINDSSNIIDYFKILVYHIFLIFLTHFIN